MRSPHTVAVLIIPGALPLDVAIPVQTFREPEYLVRACGQGSSVQGDGLRFEGLHPLSTIIRADTVMVPGYSDPASPLAPEVLDALRRAHERGARVASICTGAFALAAAGILDRRPATTHWRATDDLRSRFPLVDVQPSQLFVDDGDVLTSAGVMAGMDLCLHMVRRDHGAHAAVERARGLVVAPRRHGGQSAYMPRLAAAAESDSITELCSWIRENLAAAHRVDDLACRLHLSRRTFIRRFQEATGVPPMRWVVAARVDAARELLEITDWTVDRIGEHTGLGVGAGIRSAFHAHLGLSPRAYRSQFSQRASDTAAASIRRP